MKKCLHAILVLIFCSGCFGEGSDAVTKKQVKVIKKEARFNYVCVDNNGEITIVKNTPWSHSNVGDSIIIEKWCFNEGYSFGSAIEEETK